MRRFPELKLNIWDGLVALLVALAAVLCGVTVWSGQEQSDRLTVVITVDGQEVERCALEKFPEWQTYTGNGYTLQVGLDYPIYPDQPCVRVAGSDCPTQDCVHTGEIYRAGQSIVCLPARIIIQLEGAAEASDGPDIVIG